MKVRDTTLEDWVEVPSDIVPFDQAPEMKAPEVADIVMADLRDGGHLFIRVNFANGDMVGHTGSIEAAIRAIEFVDHCMGEIEATVRETGATMVVTADHGNLEMMWEVDPKSSTVKLDDTGRPMIKTSHTLSPVPWCVVGAEASRFAANPEVTEPGLGNIAATILMLLGFQAPPDYLPSLLTLKGGRF